MPIKTNFSLAVFLAFVCFAQAQADCDGERYRFTSAFDNISVSADHVYGSNVDALGVETDLVFDFYEAEGAPEPDRPLLIMAHGGFFLGGANDGLDVVPMCEDFARMGYAVASISYRLGIANVFDLENELVKAVWRGVHDSRAAVRYFRKSVAEDGNPWGIDPNRIYLGGVSAGGFIAVHHARIVPGKVDVGVVGIGVLAGILQCFLGNAEQLEFNPFIQMLGDIRTVQLHRHAMVPVTEGQTVQPVGH